MNNRWENAPHHKGRGSFDEALKLMKKYVTLTRRTFFFLLGGALLSLVFMVNFVHQVSAKESTGGDVYRSLKSFSDVLALVQKNYVKPVEIDKLVEGAIQGMLMTLDPHSGYLAPTNYNELRIETKGKFGGLGIEITIKDNLLTVVSPIEDSPAARAGVRAGDKIIKIGDEFTKNLSLVDAVKKMRGPKGTPITISVARQGARDLIPLTVIRDIIKVKSVRRRMLDEGFGYIRLAQFQEASAAEFAEAMKKLAAQAPEKKLNGLVIDLRNNPGGLLTQAIRVADLFLTDDVIVYTDGRLESQKQKYYAHNDGNEPEFPIIILVNEGSASASEIVAGAMQDHGRAVILGAQSFGKGSVQTILPLDDGAALRLTTALYFTKSGRSIQAQGITPDISVSAKRFPGDDEELLEEDEAPTSLMPKEKDLPGAIKNPGEKDKKEVKESNPAKPQASIGSVSEEPYIIGSRKALSADLAELLKNDPQLDEALRLLKTWHVFQGKIPLQAKKEGEKKA